MHAKGPERIAACRHGLAISWLYRGRAAASGRREEKQRLYYLTVRLLGIETSCDETAAAVVEDSVVRSCVIASSQAAFRASGGVIPEHAARRQLECILPVIEQALDGVIADPRTLDAIAVTKGPGLLGSLLIGTTSARVLSHTWGVPLVGVHHTLGHLSSTWLRLPEQEIDEPVFPLLALSVSGGHTEIWLRTSHTQGKLVGRTRDDAAGEAFDKGATLLGLPYPGGPAIAEAAMNGDTSAFVLPSPLKQEDTLDFSFSGLKTALRYTIRDMGGDPSLRLHDLAASYEAALCRHLVDRVARACKRFPDVKEVHVVGGVSANRTLRKMLTDHLPSVAVRAPAAFTYCTDNAAMIAAAGGFLIEELGEKAYEAFDTVASLGLEEAVKA